MKKIPNETILWAGASFFFTLSAIFGLMLENLDIVRIGDIARPLAILPALAVFATLLLMAIDPPLGRVLPVAIFGYFSFHALNEFFSKFGHEEIISYAILAGVYLAFYRLLRRIHSLRAPGYTFVAAAAMASAQIVLIAPSMFYEPPPPIDRYFETESGAAILARRAEGPDLPDIIYVIPDRYASQSTLLREFDFDNGLFYAELRKRGFFVSENSWSNYPKTFLSMASTLNSGYLEGFTKAYGAKSWDKRPTYEAIEDNIVQHRLRKLGYRFHNYGNTWEATRANRWAAVNYRGYPPGSLGNLSEFERALLRKTPTFNLMELFGEAEHKRECRRIKRKFRRLQIIGNQSRPVFALAHILVPHDPILMDADGKCLDPALNDSHRQGVPWDTFKAAYVEYLKFFNTAILAMIDAQLKRRGPTGRKLLFVIQADEGPFPESLRRAENTYDFSRLSRREIEMKAGIINAILLPGNMAQTIPPIVTPVNNWRIILGAITGHKMKLLPEKIFIYPTEKNVYAFCDITNVIMNPGLPYRSCED